jgi:hypothetical protein
MAPIVCSEVNENKMKYFVKSGLANTRDLVSATLIYLNDFLDYRFHLISFHFLSMKVICFIILTRFVMNILKKFTFPRKDFTSFLLREVSIFKIPSTLLGSILIPYFEMMCPNKFSSYIPKCDFFGFNDMPNFLHLWKTFFRCPRCCSLESEYTIMSSR